ncbi:MAG: hypothetical protein IJL08_07655 [Oscillospiraceae bacterium]|jgi:uncharacterized paraquat-inducible protein A|nr:hypothetical protein [Oscillospiraceae bacterium]
MSFLQRIGNSLARFMYGRNGADQLGLGMIWLLVILNIVSIFVRGGILASVLNVAALLLAVCIIFRIFSRNLPKRRAENAAFVNKVWNPIRNRIANTRNQARDKDHKYFTCPQCRAVCRVPKGKGNIVITCPRCGNQIHGKS